MRLRLRGSEHVWGSRRERRTSNYQFATPSWSSTYSQYKTYTFDKQTSILTSSSTPVMYDNAGSSTTFKWNENAIRMELFEATDANRAALNCATDVIV